MEAVYYLVIEDDIHTHCHDILTKVSETHYFNWNIGQKIKIDSSKIMPITDVFEPKYIMKEGHLPTSEFQFHLKKDDKLELLSMDGFECGLCICRKENEIMLAPELTPENSTITRLSKIKQTAQRKEKILCRKSTGFNFND